jgi:acetolactate synthase regulatory subunit
MIVCVNFHIFSLDLHHKLCNKRGFNVKPALARKYCESTTAMSDVVVTSSRPVAPLIVKFGVFLRAPQMVKYM